MNRTMLTDGGGILISIRKLEAYFSPEKPFYNRKYSPTFLAKRRGIFLNNMRILFSPVLLWTKNSMKQAYLVDFSEIYRSGF